MLKQFIVNMGNIADGLKMLGSIMEMKKDAGRLSKLAFNDAVERLEWLIRSVECLKPLNRCLA